MTSFSLSETFAENLDTVYLTPLIYVNHIWPPPRHFQIPYSLSHWGKYPANQYFQDYELIIIFKSFWVQIQEIKSIQFWNISDTSLYLIS